MDINEEIKRVKDSYKDKLLILAHYYQPNEIVAQADFVGDSYALALKASQTKAEKIVFCGVSFMAESACVLAKPFQQVFLPAMDAGCPLADMLTASEFRQAYADAERKLAQKLVSVLYINSSSAIKAEVAERGGLCCTSSNAGLIVESLLAAGKIVFFFPDKNLGLNTAIALGLKPEEVSIYKRNQGLIASSAQLKMIIWDGFCNVHVNFKESDVYKAKNLYPSARIIVHPECNPEVVKLADFAGSTSALIKQCEQAEPGTVIFMGTEFNLVNRLARSFPNLKIFPLRKAGCINMNKITPAKLKQALSTLDTDNSPFRVTVDPAELEGSRLALKRMIEIVESKWKN